jgi:hypothetical protein
MSTEVTRWKLPFVALVAIAGLAIVGTHFRHHAGSLCALDGATIEPIYQVRIVDSDDQSRAFCCIHCGELWLQKQKTPPRSISVTDEATGLEIDAAQAQYVRSRLITNAPTGNRVHVFAKLADAQRHAALFAGKILSSEECPFQGRTSNFDLRASAEGRSSKVEARNIVPP